MRVIAWVAYATLFLLLFGLALNNQHEGTVKGFFGAEWRAPMIVVVCLSFGAGAVLTLLAMLPASLRRGALRAPSGGAASPGGTRETPPSAPAFHPADRETAAQAGSNRGSAAAVTPGKPNSHPLRDGL